MPCVRVGAEGSGAADEITAAPIGYGGLWAFHMGGERLGLCDPVSGVGLLLLLRANVPLRRMYRLALREAVRVGRR